MNVLKRILMYCGTLLPTLLYGHGYEVLFPYSLGYDAVNFENKADFSSEFRGVLVDGKIESLGTETTTFDRSLISHVRLKGNFPLAPKLALRSVISGVNSYRKLEGKDEPRIIRQELSTDLKPRLELTYFTQNALEVFIGLSYRAILPYKAKIESVDSTSTEKFSQVAYKFPHLGFVKRGSGFKGGFYFQQGAEKSRTVEKSNDRDNVVLNQEDRVQDPTYLAIFAKVPLGRSQIYAEFAAVQAGELGNRSSSGASVEEDYIRLFFEYELPPIVSGINAQGAILYKTLSYADNTNVSLTSIPQLGLHFTASLQLGAFKAQAGTIFAYGKDAQSIDEFNANYSLFAVGAHLGLLVTF